MHTRASDGGMNVFPAIVWQGSGPYESATERAGKPRATRLSTSALETNILLAGEQEHLTSFCIYFVKCMLHELTDNRSHNQQHVV